MERVFKGEISKEEAFLEIDTKEKAADELVTETVERLRKNIHHSNGSRRYSASNRPIGYYIG